jgi:DNA-binding transcriptional ArsR family regulator
MGLSTRCVTAACGIVGGVATEKDRIEKVLAALSDPTRRRLLDVLAAQGQATATTLAPTVSVSRQAVVKHLQVLYEAGLVSRSRMGRDVRYTVCPEQLDATARWMADLAAEWDRRLESIKRIAEMSDGSD